MSKNLDQTVRLQSEKRQKWIRGIRREKQQGIAENASSAPRLTSSSATSFPRRNKCREMSREEKRNDRLVGAAETSKECAEWRRLQQKNWSILGLLKRKEWSQCHKESSWQLRQSRPCQKEKEQSRLFRVPDHEGERVKMGESRTLARERRIRARAWRGKGGLHGDGRQIPRKKEREGKQKKPP